MVLGHRRLAIIDLSSFGHQPMSGFGEQVHIVFNGEIYNYRDLREELRTLGASFTGGSDTEVLLAAYMAWGEDCLNRLNGMFAFVLYDVRRGLLFGARDRAGEKPLFYRHEAARFSFASELKALLADESAPRSIDLEALNSYLAYGYVPADGCLLRGYRKLPAAHAFSYDVGQDRFRVWRYWELPDPPVELTVANECDLTAELEGLLEASVRRQLIADVPVGILLSGGIDSSLVTAVAARVSDSPINTFTVGFPDARSHDERPHARKVASHFGTRHVELVAEPTSVDLLPILARQFDEPIADSSMLPTYLVSRLIRQHATVALGGDGGDELFAGYPHHKWIMQQELARHVVPRPVRRTIGAAITRGLPRGLKGRNYLLGYAMDLDESLTQWGRFFDRAERERLLAPAGANITDAPEGRKRAAFADRGDALQRATAVDFSSYMTDDILVKVDRASMLNSLELRSPWLDYRIIEFAFGRVPTRLRASVTEQKILPRRLASRLLPKSLDLDRKQGFSIPLASWFKGQWGSYMEEVLSEADPLLFSQSEIRRLVRSQRRGLSHTNRLFALTLFELWRRAYRVTLA